MSSQRGNAQRCRGQKYQNKTAFKNTMHDTSRKTKVINNIAATGCCARCKDIIDWKVKYKKYKLLTQPKTCVKCGQKTVKKNYYTVCDDCATKAQVCAKCGQQKDIAVPVGLTAAEEASQNSQLQNELKVLTERQRRTFYRLQESGKLKELHDNPDAPQQDAGTDSESDCSDADVSDDNVEDEQTDCTQSSTNDKLQSLTLQDQEDIGATITREKHVQFQ